MKKYFVWTRDIEHVIYETLSDKTKRLASNSDVIVKLFNTAADDLPRLFQPIITEDFRIAANSFGVR
jgi:hypothetical protein